MYRHKWAVVSVLIFFTFWQLLGMTACIDTTLFPTPVSIFIDLSRQLMTASMWENIGVSLGRLLLGFLLGWPAGIILAVAAGSFVGVRSILAPFVNFGYPLPKVALIPLTLVLFGIGDLSKIVLIATGVFFLMYISVMNGVLLLKGQPTMDVALVYRIRGFKYWTAVVLRGLTLDILTASKAAFGYGLVLVVVTEAQMTKSGIGFFIWQAWEQYRIIEIYDAIFLLGFIGMIAGAFFDWATRILLDKYRLV